MYIHTHIELYTYIFTHMYISRVAGEGLIPGQGGGARRRVETSARG